MNLFKIKNSKWSDKKKTIIWCIIGLLTVLLLTSVFFNFKGFYLNNHDEYLNNQIYFDLMSINPKQDPDVAKIISDIIIDVCNEYDVPVELVIAIIDVESKCKVKAENVESQAVGLMQWLASEKRLKEYQKEKWEAIHIRFNIWDCVRILREDGIDEGKGIKNALFHYNGVKANIKDGNRYVADVMCKYYDLVHKEVEDEKNKLEKNME